MDAGSRSRERASQRRRKRVRGTSEVPDRASQCARVFCRNTASSNKVQRAYMIDGVRFCVVPHAGVRDASGFDVLTRTPHCCRSVGLLVPRNRISRRVSGQRELRRPCEIENPSSGVASGTVRSDLTVYRCGSDWVACWYLIPTGATRGESKACKDYRIYDGDGGGASTDRRPRRESVPAIQCHSPTNVPCCIEHFPTCTMLCQPVRLRRKLHQKCVWAPWRVRCWCGERESAGQPPFPVCK